MEAEDQWKTIWEILFQESNPAERPYLDNVVEEVISIIRDFCNNIEGNQVVSGFVQSQNLPTGLTASAQRLMTGLLDEFRAHFSQALCGSYQVATLETQTDDNQQDKSLQKNGKNILSDPIYCSVPEDIKQEPFSRSSSLDDYECYWSNNTSEPSYTLAPSPSPDYSTFLPVSLDLLPGQLSFNGTTYPDSGGLPENDKWDIDGPSGMHKACNSQMFNEPSPVYYSSDDMASTELLALQPDQFSDPDNLSFHLPQDEVEF
ncbi:hypothetical protein FALBO_9988 [Fusarium albosuccineum]|uniref:Uncharacterized protein n=1 Tax=Fusarium albosuccineum TaxID=1237068 RepID=A0A8H4L8N4_9HYPO|nr:hypothetical protein FALBO_9988 [Fusarium albosuccineum]